MEIIVTGGAGYIGSTICSLLSDKGHTPIIWDSLITGNPDYVKGYDFFHSDISNFETLNKIKIKYPNCKTLIHCAARIVVSESVANPLLYYKENVAKSVDLFKHCVDLGINNLIFSSSASVYGPNNMPGVSEDQRCSPLSPYAETKLIIEKVLTALSEAEKISAISLRYFNPIGCDPKFRTGPFVENPTHLLGRLLDSTNSSSQTFEIFGNDWPSRDGTCIRDFIHIWDLANAHLKAVEYLGKMGNRPGHEVFNIGTGTGTTVKEFLDTFQRITDKKIEFRFAEARPGDVLGNYAIADKAKLTLGWSPNLSLEDAISDAYRWKNLKIGR